MAFEDEYEVARLATHDRTVRNRITLPVPLNFRIACSLVALRGFSQSCFRKLVYRALLALKRVKLRGTPLTPSDITRRLERELIDWYRQLVEAILPHLHADRYAECVELAQSADEIRG